MSRFITSQAVRAAVARPAFRPFSTTSAFALKESSSQTDADYEAHKQDSLKKQKAGSAEWKRELASDSEEAVKADDHGQSVKEMQDSAKKAAEAEKGK